MANLYLSDTLSDLEGYLFGTPIESANGLTGNNNVQVEMALRYAVGDVDSSSGYMIQAGSFSSTASQISFVVLGPVGVDPVKVVLSGSGFTPNASGLGGVYGQSAFSINQIQVLSSKTGSIDWNAPVTTLTVDTSINVTSQGRLDNFSLSGITMQEGSLKVALKGALSLGNLIDSSGNVSFSGATFNNGKLEIVYDTNADPSKTELAQITLNGNFTYDAGKSSSLAVDGVVSGFGLKVFGGTDLTADPVHYLYGTDLGITLTELRDLEGNNWSLATALQHVFDGASDTVYTYVDTMIPEGFERVVIEGTGDVNIEGNSRSNVIFGNAGDNVVHGASSPPVDYEVVVDVGAVTGDGVLVRTGYGSSVYPYLDSTVVPPGSETQEPSIYFSSGAELFVSNGYDLGAADFDLSFSFKADSTLPSYSNILGSYGGLSISNDPAYGGKLRITLQEGVTDVYASGTEVGRIVSAESVNDGQWHSVLLSRDSDTFSLYLDGALEGTATVPLDFEVDLSQFVLGHLVGYWSQNWDNSYKGWLNDFQVSVAHANEPDIDTFVTTGTLTSGLLNADGSIEIKTSTGGTDTLYDVEKVQVGNAAAVDAMSLVTGMSSIADTYAFQLNSAGTVSSDQFLSTLQYDITPFKVTLGEKSANGYVQLDDTVADWAALDAYGRTLIWGYKSGLSNDFAIARLSADGTVDQTFGVGGWTYTQQNGSSATHEYVYSVIPMADGRILASGACYENGVRGIQIVRYFENGAIDPAFGTNGVFRLVPFTGHNFADISLRGDGTIVIGSRGQSSDGKDLLLDADGKTYQLIDDLRTYEIPSGSGITEYQSDGTTYAVRWNTSTQRNELFLALSDGSLSDSFGDVTNPGRIGLPSAQDLGLNWMNYEDVYRSQDGSIFVLARAYDQTNVSKVVILGFSGGGAPITSFGEEGSVIFDSEAAYQILSYSAEEGQFLLTGIDYNNGTSSGHVFTAKVETAILTARNYVLSGFNGTEVPAWLNLDISDDTVSLSVEGATVADAGHNYFVLTATGSTSVSRVFDVYIKPLDAGTNDIYVLDTTKVAVGSTIVPLDKDGNPSPLGLDTLDLSGSNGLVGASSDIIVDAKNGEIVYWAGGAASSDPVSYTFEGFEKYVLGASTGYFIGRDDLSEYVVIKAGKGYDIVLGSSLTGRVETDIISFEGGQAGVEIALSNADDPNTFVAAKVGTGTGAVTHQISGAEGVIGSEAGDKITGNYADNLLVGNGGDDEIRGGDGNDALVGGAGAGDKLFGGAGGDWLVDLDGGTLRGNDVQLLANNKADAQRDVFVVNKGATIENFQLSESGTGLAGRAQNANDAIVFNLNLGVIAGLTDVTGWSWVNYNDGMTTAQKEAFSAAVSSHVKFKNPIETTVGDVTSVKLELYMYETRNSDGTLSGREVKVGETTIADVKKASGDQLVIVGLNNTAYHAPDAIFDESSFPKLFEDVLFAKSETANIAIALESVKAGTIRQLPGQVVMSAKWDNNPHFYNPAEGNQKIIATNASDTVELLVQTLADVDANGKGQAGSDKVYDIGGEDTLSFSNAKIEDLHFEAVKIGRETGNQSLKVSYEQTNGTDTNVGDLTWTGHFRSGVDMALDQVTVADASDADVKVTYQMADTVYKWDKGVFKGVDLVAQAGEDTIMVGQDDAGTRDHFVIKDGFTSNTTVETTDIYIWGLDSNAAAANNNANTLDKIDLSDFGLLDSGDIAMDTANQTMTVSIANSAGTAADKLVIHLMDTNLTTLDDILVYQKVAA